MDRVAAFVDAGYLFAQGSVALAGHKLPRGEVELKHSRALEALEKLARELSGLPLLRVYWYDGTSTGPTAQHRALAYLPGLKLRLGFVNSYGEQKGVDSLIVTDMIALARNRAMADAVLLSGDEDLRVGVQQAQELGVRVHLLGIQPSRENQSSFLRQEADSTHEWGPAELRVFLSCNPALPVKPGLLGQEMGHGSTLEPSAQDSLVQVAELLAEQIEDSELRAFVTIMRQPESLIPSELDARLLSRGSNVLKSQLNPAQKRQLRDAFRAACEARLAADSEAGP